MGTNFHRNLNENTYKSIWNIRLKNCGHFVSYTNVSVSMTPGHNGFTWWLFSNMMIKCHYSDVIMGAMASQITTVSIVYSPVYSSADQRKHQSSVSLAFVRGIHRWPVNSPHKGPLTRKMVPFDDVIIREVLFACILISVFYSFFINLTQSPECFDIVQINVPSKFYAYNLHYPFLNELMFLNCIQLTITYVMHFSVISVAVNLFLRVVICT